MNTCGFLKFRPQRVTLVTIFGAMLALLLFHGSVFDLFLITAAEIREADSKISLYHAKRRLFEQIRSDETADTASLLNFEDQLAPPDAYLWMIKQVTMLAPANMKLHVGPPEPDHTTLLQCLAYQGLKFKISGTSTFEELGLLIANLENSASLFKISGLQISTAQKSENGGHVQFFLVVIGLSHRRQEG